MTEAAAPAGPRLGSKRRRRRAVAVAVEVEVAMGRRRGGVEWLQWDAVGVGSSTGRERGRDDGRDAGRKGSRESTRDEKEIGPSQHEIGPADGPERARETG